MGVLLKRRVLNLKKNILVGRMLGYPQIDKI